MSEFKVGDKVRAKNFDGEGVVTEIYDGKVAVEFGAEGFWTYVGSHVTGMLRLVPQTPDARLRKHLDLALAALQAIGELSDADADERGWMVRDALAVIRKVGDE